MFEEKNRDQVLLACATSSRVPKAGKHLRLDRSNLITGFFFGRGKELAVIKK